MNTQEMFTALRAFAEVADGAPAEELRRFATVFEGGKSEAVAARIKRALNHWPAQQPAHPAGLRKSLVGIASGLSACGAKKQTSDFQAILALFGGEGTAAVESFVEQVAAALTAPPVKSSQRASGSSRQIVRSQVSWPRSLPMQCWTRMRSQD